MSVMPKTDFLDPRLLAPNANLLPAFSQGVAAAGQLGSLADMINARRRTAATEADAIAAENARNKLVAAGSLADLGQVPQRALVTGRRLALEGGQLTGQLGNLQTQQDLDRAMLEAQAAEAARKKSVLEQTAEPRTNTEILNADLALGAAQTATAAQPAASEAAVAKSKVEAIAANQALSDAEATQQIMDADPNMRVADLKATIAARRATREAETARAKAQAEAGGMTPAEQIAAENQKRLADYNAGQLKIAEQNAATNAAKIAAAANDPLKLSKVHLELGKSVLSNGQTVEQALGNIGGAEKPWFHSNLTPTDMQVVNSYAQLSSRLAQGAVAPAAAPGPWSAFEGRTLNGPGGARVKIVNGNPVPIQ